MGRMTRAMARALTLIASLLWSQHGLSTAAKIPRATDGPITHIKQVAPPLVSPSPVRDIYARCGSQSYKYPATEKVCAGQSCPKLKSSEAALGLPLPQGFKCERMDRNSRISIIALRPLNGSALDKIRTSVPSSWAPELIGYEDEDQSTAEAATKHKDVISKVHNHFFVYTNHYLGYLRPINRLVKLANAEVVLVVPKGGQLTTVRTEWVAAAVAAMQQHQSLAIVGMQGVDGTAGSGEIEFMHAVQLDQPLVIRRSAFLSVGLVDTSSFCPAKGDKEEHVVWKSFCNSLWRHGLSVAALDWEANVSASSKAAIPEQLRELWPSGTGTCAGDTNEQKRGRQDCAHGPDLPPASIIVQYFRRERNVQLMGKELRNIEGMEGADLMINDDSQTEHGLWMAALKDAKNVWLVHSPNIHEIRGYNRLGKLANAELVAMMQDDDHARELDWMQRAKELFDGHPKLALLGGRAGRMDTGKEMEVKGERKSIPGYTPGPLWQNDGPKYGFKYTKIAKMDPATGIPFDFVYKVNASPLVVRRSVFLKTGMYHPQMSCVGESGISFDFEYSVRMWKHGYQVGLYYAYFEDFKNSRSTGTWASAMATRKRLVTWRRNNLLLYYMYPGFHHRVGTNLPVKASNNRAAVVPITCGGKGMVKNRCPLQKPKGGGMLSSLFSGRRRQATRGRATPRTRAPPPRG